MLKTNSERFMQDFDAATKAGNIASWEYDGRLLLPGEDASIVVTKSSMTATIGNAHALEDHPIYEFVADFEEQIRDVAAEDLGSHREIIIGGRWHYYGEKRQQSFEPYLTRKITQDGSVKTAKYDYDFFGWGGYGFGLIFDPGTDGESALEAMTAETANFTNYSRLRPGVAEDFGLPTGVVWFPAAPSQLPFLVVEHANKIFERRSA